MNLVAIQMLIGDRLKYLTLVAGVTFAALLITQQASIFNGFSQRASAWLRDTSIADLWVMDPQVEFTEDFKPMSDTALQRVRGVSGVAWAVPMYKSYLRVRLPDGTLVQSRIIGLEDASLTGGPPIMVEGKLEDLRRDRGVIINIDQASDSLKLRNDGDRPLRVGDSISINDHDAVVVGTYKSTREFFWDPVIYTTYSRALTWAPRQRRQLMYVLTKVADGQNPAEVARRITETTGLAALTGKQFESQSTEWILNKTGIRVNFGITIALGFVIGILVAGQTFYTFVIDNLRQFATLKAMGTGTPRLLGMLSLQVLLVALLGYGIGAGLAAAAGQGLMSIGLAFEMRWPIVAMGAASVVFCCLVAAALGMIRVIRLEPAVVFK